MKAIWRWTTWWAGGAGQTFNFLGSIMISEDGSCKQEVVRRLAIARTKMSSLQRMWKDHDLSVRTQKRIVETMVFPVATYGAEPWTVTVDLQRRIQGFWDVVLEKDASNSMDTEGYTNRSILETIWEPVPLNGLMYHVQNHNRYCKFNPYLRYFLLRLLSKGSHYGPLWELIMASHTYDLGHQGLAMDLL